MIGAGKKNSALTVWNTTSAAYTQNRQMLFGVMLTIALPLAAVVVLVFHHLIAQEAWHRGIQIAVILIGIVMAVVLSRRVRYIANETFTGKAERNRVRKVVAAQLVPYLFMMSVASLAPGMTLAEAISEAAYLFVVLLIINAVALLVLEWFYQRWTERSAIENPKPPTR